jgi:hypothetical protein
MKIQVRRDGGSVFIVILVITGLMGVTLASYLHMVSNQNTSIMRSMAWNEAVAISEAGIEEAMAHLNRNRTNRARDGWVLDGTNVVKEKTIRGQKFKTYIDAFADRPAIVSEGWVKNPKTGEMLPRPRNVRVTTTNDAIFAKGMVAKGSIDLAGNGIVSDSFDSTTETASTGGRYDPAKRRDKGDVATNSSVIDSLNAWNAEIYGRASTGPGGNVKLHNGTVGSLAHHASGVGGIEPGWTTDDMNVYFPDVDYPYGSFTEVNSINIPIYLPSGTSLVDGAGVYFEYRSFGGYFKLKNGLSLNNKKLYIESDTTLLIESGFSISGNGAIIIATNANLQIYMAGATTSIGGNGIVNKSGRAANFSYWGMPSNTAINIQGNGDFIGTLYAPQAALAMGGGGSTGDDFMGALVTASVTLNGHYEFHYDESLGVFGPRRGYTIVTWNEIGWSNL